MQEIPEAISALPKILERYDPSQVILFSGSTPDTAVETHGADFLVVLKATPSRTQIRRFCVELERDLQVPVQVFFMTQQEFDGSRNVKGRKAYSAERWGEVLFAAGQ